MTREDDSKSADSQNSTDRRAELAKQAGEKSSGILAELLGFLVEYQKWWLIPILAVLLILGVFLLITSSPLAPFLYPLF